MYMTADRKDAFVIIKIVRFSGKEYTHQIKNSIFLPPSHSKFVCHLYEQGVQTLLNTEIASNNYQSPLTSIFSQVLQKETLENDKILGERKPVNPNETFGAHTALHSLK